MKFVVQRDIADRVIEEIRNATDDEIRALAYFADLP